MSAGIEADINDVFMQVVKHRMDALRKKGKIKIRPLIEEYVHCFLAEHKIILEEDGAKEGLAESLMNSWESSYQQENMLIGKSTGDKIFNIFEINELCISTGITCDEPYEVVPEVNEETDEYPCTLDMDQIQNIVLGLKDEMTRSRRDKPK